MFLWLTSPFTTTSYHPPASASGFSISPFSEFGDSQVSKDPWDNEKEWAGDLVPICSHHPLLASERIVIWVPEWEGSGLERELLQILALSTQTLQPYGPRVAESAGQARTTWALRLGRMGQKIWDFPQPLPLSIYHSPQISLGEFQQIITGTPYTPIKHSAQASYTRSLRLEGRQNIHKQRE